LVAAEVHSGMTKHFEGPQAGQKQMQLEETAGIPTGLALDIHRQVELRKAKCAAAPDNMGHNPTQKLGFVRPAVV
jgi:hypothetical protein